jgi:hypothetical protein
MVMNSGIHVRNFFRRSLVSPTEIVPEKLSVEKIHDLEKQNIYVGISRQSRNGRIRTMVFPLFKNNFTSVLSFLG